MLGGGHYTVRVPFLEEDTGAGSLISNVLSSVGARPCGGCKERAEALDSWLRFKGRDGEKEEEKVERAWY